MEKTMNTKSLVVLLMLLGGVSATAQDKASATETKEAQTKDARSTEATKKGPPTQGQDAAKDKSEKPEIHEFVIANFRTESGVTLPQARVVYGTYGHLNAARDNVEAVHRLLTEELKVKHLRAIVGFSMGAQQAFQWAVSYPAFADKIVATAGTAKTYPHG